jgi:hypothetical protein
VTWKAANCGVSFDYQIFPVDKTSF